MEADGTSTGTRRMGKTWLGAGEGVVAVSALGGAYALVTGSIDLGTPVTARLPLASPTLGGLALAAVVGVPMAVGSAEALRGTARADGAALVAGGLLVAWIVVEVAVIRSLSWLQPVFLAAGAAVAVAGGRGLRSSHRHPR